MGDETQNFEIINLKDNSQASYLYCFEDKCLFKKNGVRKRGGGEVNYICIGDKTAKEKCIVTGKLEKNKFVKLGRKAKEHNHECHEHQMNALKIRGELREGAKNSHEPIEKLFNAKTQG
jgi:hypothetical protein